MGENQTKERWILAEAASAEQGGSMLQLNPDAKRRSSKTQWGSTTKNPRPGKRQRPTGRGGEGQTPSRGKEAAALA